MQRPNPRRLFFSQRDRYCYIPSLQDQRSWEFLSLKAFGPIVFPQISIYTRSSWWALAPQPRHIAFASAHPPESRPMSGGALWYSRWHCCSNNSRKCFVAFRNTAHQLFYGFLKSVLAMSLAVLHCRLALLEPFACEGFSSFFFFYFATPHSCIPVLVVVFSPWLILSPPSNIRERNYSGTI